MQLDLFTDTGEGCSFVARPVRTNTDGFVTPAFGKGKRCEVLSAASEKAEQADCSLSGDYSESLEFDGETYEPEHDAMRLGKQALAVMELMRDGQWRTLREITEAIGGGSEAGVSARLRDFRKSSFGGHVVNRRRRGVGSAGVFEYQVQVKP